MCLRFVCVLSMCVVWLCWCVICVLAYVACRLFASGVMCWLCVFYMICNVSNARGYAGVCFVFVSLFASWLSIVCMWFACVAMLMCAL